MKCKIFSSFWYIYKSLYNLQILETQSVKTSDWGAITKNVKRVYREYDSKSTDMLWQEYDKVEFKPLYPFVYKGLRYVYYWVGVKYRKADS